MNQRLAEGGLCVVVLQGGGIKRFLFSETNPACKALTQVPATAIFIPANWLKQALSC